MLSRRSRPVALLLFLLMALSAAWPGSLHAAEPETPETGTALIHYHRDDGNYAGWGLHVWQDTSDQVTWDEPLLPAGVTDFGVYFRVGLTEGAQQIGLIVHQGDLKDPGADQFLELSQGSQGWILSGDSTLYTQPPDLGAALAPDQAAEMVSFPGSYAHTLGGTDWEPADPTVQARDEEGNGIWSFSVALPAGDYAFKVAVNGSWQENYGVGRRAGGFDIPLQIREDGTQVTFGYERATHAIWASFGAVVPLPTALGDGRIGRAGLAHDSRSDLYRSPFGAVPLETPVTLRLRTYAGDVEQVLLRAESLTGGASRTLPMARVATDLAAPPLGYDWWEVTLESGSAVDLLNYHFLVTDGATTVIVADDPALDGGNGQVYGSSPGSERGWDLYIYLPDFSTPDWAQNAIIYQIFPDRFRNGDPTNDPTAEEWFYPQERGHAFPIAPWNRIVPDPEPNDPTNNPDWYLTYSATFYGGDLQGIEEKLDYLQELGVTAIYLNPIFESPSNHRYDGRSYRQVDDALAVAGDAEASMALFDRFAAEVHARGMRLILDAVPNHLSSDTPFFDRFQRHAEVGACESVESPYRDWFFFDPAQPAGSGVCAGDTNYRAWAGVSTLPQLNTAHPDVVDSWFGPEGYATYWLDKPGVDGWRIDVVPDVVGVNPDFFPQWRTVTKAAHPDSISYAETWSERDVRPRVLGNEFDSTMNYRFRSALLGFLRDSVFNDNDGSIAPLTATQFEAALRAIEEDYPYPAFAAAMNLLGSHDVNRAVRVLDHDPVDYGRQEPSNGFADGRRRLRLAAALQLTLPGAPTIYYGDEVGLVGFGTDIPRDDPYNRQPYPWPDAEGYDQLPDWRQQHTDLLDEYRRLGQLRNAHSFLRTGSWETLLLADEAGTVVYGRKDASGAAIVTVNRGTAPTTVALDLTGYLPLGTELSAAFSSVTTTIPATGSLFFSVSPMDYQIWLTAGAVDFTAPPAARISGSQEEDGILTVEVTGSDPLPAAYVIWRSVVDGGYQPVATLPAGPRTTFYDSEVINGQGYYYRVTAQAANGLESAPSLAVRLVPHYQIAAANLQILELSHTLSAITPTLPITGLVQIDGVSALDGPTPGLLAQLGYAPAGSAEWRWVDAQFSGDEAGADLFSATLLPDSSGTYDFAMRFSTTGGRDWQPTAERGVLTVSPSSDTEAPRTPFRLDEIFSASEQLVFAWRLSRSPDLHHFRICRADVTVGEEGCATSIIVPAAQQIYTDTLVSTDHTYVYTVESVDTSFNRSAPSAPLTLTAAESFVDITFLVRVPAETPADESIYIAGDNANAFGAVFNPGLQSMAPAGENLWSWTANVKSGTALAYKYTRGNWETVEQWGTITGFTNRTVTAVASPSGTQLVDDTATDWDAEGSDDHRAVRSWRDPLVTVTEPVSRTVAPLTAVSVTLSIAASPVGDLANLLSVQDAAEAKVVGVVTAIGDRAYLFTPQEPLGSGVYTATLANLQASVPLQRPYVWSLEVVEEADE